MIFFVDPLPGAEAIGRWCNPNDRGARMFPAAPRHRRPGRIFPAGYAAKSAFGGGRGASSGRSGCAKETPASTPNTAQKAAQPRQIPPFGLSDVAPNHLFRLDLADLIDNGGRNLLDAPSDPGDRRLESWEATAMWDLSSEIEDLVL